MSDRRRQIAQPLQRHPIVAAAHSARCSSVSAASMSLPCLRASGRRRSRRPPPASSASSSARSRPARPRRRPARPRSSVGTKKLGSAAGPPAIPVPSASHAFDSGHGPGSFCRLDSARQIVPGLCARIRPSTSDSRWHGTCSFLYQIAAYPFAPATAEACLDPVPSPARSGVPARRRPAGRRPGAHQGNRRRRGHPRDQLIGYGLVDA